MMLGWAAERPNNKGFSGFRISDSGFRIPDKSYSLSKSNEYYEEVSSEMF